MKGSVHQSMKYLLQRYHKMLEVYTHDRVYIAFSCTQSLLINETILHYYSVFYLIKTGIRVYDRKYIVISIPSGTESTSIAGTKG